ncbi:MAG: DUF892 family protein [Planctomycetota bacterium]|nr:MAG: DUF892 family protein [Planctomycetota bacterium]
MATKFDSLQSLFEFEMREIYSFENQLVDALPELIEIANDPWLKKEIAGYESQAEKHLEILREHFARLGIEPDDHECRAMKQLLDEAKALKTDGSDPRVRDAALIAILQRIEHLGMAAYGTAAAFADELGHHDIAAQLKQCRSDESNANSSIAGLAARWVNFMAAKASA